jgi:hypothetical protein
MSVTLTGQGAPSIVDVSRTLFEYAPLAGETGIVNAFYPVGDIRRYGAPMNGVSDDAPATTIAITNALALKAGTLRLPMGTIRPLSNLVASVTGAAPKGLTIKGYGYNTIIKPGPLVTIALTVAGESNTDGVTNRVKLSSFRMDGVDAAVGATGLLLGENAGNLSAYIELESIEVYRFAGAGGKNIYVKNVVGLQGQNVYAGRGETNLYVEGSDPALPTVIVFGNSQFREATKKGVNIVRGYLVRLRESVIEANAEEGVYVVPTGAKNAQQVDLDGCWFEGNYGASAINYQFRADGTAAGTVSVRIANTRFGGGLAKSIYMKNIVAFVLDNPLPKNAAGDVLIDVNCQGEIRAWPETNAPYATVVTNNSGAQVVFPKRYLPAFDQVALNAGAFAIDCFAGNVHECSATAAAFAIANPTNVINGVDLQTIRIKNASGGALGAATFGAKYKLGAAWVNPATGFNRAITFAYDPNSTNWYEVTRSAADVAN